MSPSTSPGSRTFRDVNALQTVTIVVTAGAAVLALVDYVRNGGPLSRLGREGAVWFDHLADLPLGERPSEDGARLADSAPPADRALLTLVAAADGRLSLRGGPLPRASGDAERGRLDLHDRIGGNVAAL